MRRIISVVLFVALAGACSSSKPDASPPASSSGSKVPKGSPPKFAVVLDDTGLTFPPGQTPAGSYTISFEDRRTNRKPSEHLRLEFRPSGPYVLLIDVPAGSSSVHTLLANMTPYVVDLDHAPPLGMYDPNDVARYGVVRDFPMTHAPEVLTTPEYPTPVT